MTTSTSWVDVAVDLPSPWFHLDLRSEDLATFISGLVDSRLEDEPRLVPFRDSLHALLDGFAREAIEKHAVTAGLYASGREGAPVIAHLLVYVSPAAAASEVRTLGDVAGELRTPREGDLGPREVTEVDLPSGHAVRARFLAETLRDERGDAAALECVQYWIPIPQSTDVAIVSFTTPTLHFANDLANVFDELGRTTTFRKREPRGQA